MDQLFLQIKEICLHPLNGEVILAALGKPELMWTTFLAINIIVFTETGLLFGFFLPGDSLLVTAGLVAWNSDWPLHWLIPTLCVSAIIGDSVGYYIGRRAGPRLFSRKDSFFFRKDHLAAAEAFYEKHGGKTIVLARFMPFIRTFAPVVAGIGRMNYKSFVAFNIIGGVCWVASMILFGYALTPVLDPMLKPWFGEEFKIQKYIEVVIILVVFVSISPGLYHGLKSWMKKRKAAAILPPEPVNR